jgi:hypothetical protein
MALIWTQTEPDTYDAPQVNKQIMTQDRSAALSPSKDAKFVIVKMGGDLGSQPFYQAFYVDGNLLPNGISNAEEFIQNGNRWYCGGSSDLENAKNVCEEVCRQQRPYIEERLAMLELAIFGPKDER